MELPKDNIHICPECGSINLQGVSTLNPQTINEYIVKNNKYFKGFPDNIDCFLCKDCQTLNICPIINTKDIKKFQENLRKYNDKHQRKDAIRLVKRTTSFQRFFSVALLLLFIIALVIPNILPEGHSSAYYFIPFTILFITAIISWFVWVIHNIFKE